MEVSNDIWREESEKMSLEHHERSGWEEFPRVRKKASTHTTNVYERHSDAKVEHGMGLSIESGHCTRASNGMFFSRK